MSERLYYEDAYTTRFEATVVEGLTWQGRPAVVLDGSYFYPASGGQPCDLGRLGERRVVEVAIREADGAVVHVLDGEVRTGRISAEIDWPRRFDHMQQHTGQHILSQACLRLAEAETVGFHLGDDICTIDLNIEQWTAGELSRVEQLANQIVWENRPIHARSVSQAEALQLPLRKIPSVDGPCLRLIEIEQFDLTACGGTHVARTGSVGLIKIIRLERMRGNLRLHFVCGQRALADYEQKNELSRRLVADLTCSADEVPAAVNRLRQEVKAAQRALKQTQAIALAYEAQARRGQGEVIGAAILVAHVFTNRDMAEIRGLANALAQQPGVIALLGLAGANAQLIFARAQDAPGAMNALLAIGLACLGSARGGGSAVYAQGGGVPASEVEVQAAITAAVQRLRGNAQV